MTRRVVRHSKDTGDLRIILPFYEMNLVGLFDGTPATVVFYPHELKLEIRPQDYAEIKYAITKLRELSYDDVRSIILSTCPSISEDTVKSIYDTIQGNWLVKNFWIALIISIRNARNRNDAKSILEEAIRMYCSRLKHIGW